MHTTVSLNKVSSRTEVHIVQEGIPEAIPPQACYLWLAADGVMVARAGCALTASLSPEQYRDTHGGPIATNTLTSS